MQLRGIGSGRGLGRVFMLGLGMLVASRASGHPGGTPVDVKEPGLYCATCHSSTAEADLSGTGEKSQAELAENKHLGAIRAGVGVYSTLSDADRVRLVELLSAVDRSSTISIDAPAVVAPGATFEVKVDVTGGAGPTVAVGLFDRPHRLFARSLAKHGFERVGTPTVSGGKASGGKAHLRGSPEKLRAQNLVEIEGVASSADSELWAKAQVVFTLKAPMKPGAYSIFGAYLYGTEKAVKISTQREDSRFPPYPLGGPAAASGRVKFSQERVIRVQAPGSDSTATAAP